MVPRKLHAKFGSNLLSVFLLTDCLCTISCRNDVPVETAGQVLDEGNVPIAGADVAVDGKVQAVTNKTGHFSFRAFLNSKISHKITITKQDPFRYFSESENELNLGSNKRYQTSLRVRLMSMPKHSSIDTSIDSDSRIRSSGPSAIQHALPIVKAVLPTQSQLAASRPHNAAKNHGPELIQSLIPADIGPSEALSRNIYIRSLGKPLRLATVRSFDSRTGKFNSSCTSNEHGKCRLPIPDAAAGQSLEVLASHPTQISKLVSLPMGELGPHYVDLEPGMSVTVAATLISQAGILPAAGIDILVDGTPIGATPANGLLIHALSQSAKLPTITMRNSHFVPASHGVTLSARESVMLEPMFAPRTCSQSFTWEIGSIPDPYDSVPKEIVLARIERALESARQALGFASPSPDQSCESHQLVVTLSPSEIWSFQVALKSYPQDPDRISIKHAVSSPYDGSAMEIALREAIDLALRTRSFNASVSSSNANLLNVAHAGASQDFHADQLVDAWTPRLSSESEPMLFRQTRVTELSLDALVLKNLSPNQAFWPAGGRLVRIRVSGAREPIIKIAAAPSRPATPSNSGVKLQ